MSADTPSNESLPPAPAILIPCPVCNKPTDSVRVIHTGVLLFVVFAWGLQRKKVVACLSCCRKSVFAHAAGNVITANVLWPIIVLPWTLVNYFATTAPGHDPEVLQALGLPVPEKAALGKSPPLAESSPMLSRVLGAVQMALGLLAGWGVLLAVVDSYGPYFHGYGAPGGARFMGSAVLAVCAYLLITGASRVMNLIPRARWRLGSALLLGIAAFILMGALVTAIWRFREPGYSARAMANPDGYEGSEYLWDIPPALWNPRTIAAIVEHLDPGYASDDLLENLEEFHAGDPAFAPAMETLKKKQSPRADDSSGWGPM